MGSVESLQASGEPSGREGNSDGLTEKPQQ